MTRRLRGRVLIIAGSDSSGGAGIQADIKAVTAMGAYAATAITALTAQDTRGVHGVVGVPPSFIAQQIRVVLDDVGADCIKIGMLHDSDTIRTIADSLADSAPSIPVVLDPVMVAKGGAKLLQDEAVATLRHLLLPAATLITPNTAEAAVLAGEDVSSTADQERVARMLLSMGPDAVLLKGGHLEGPAVTDVLVTGAGVEVFRSSRIETSNTHGTGCTLASAIAAGLAQGMTMTAAITRARDYVHAAIATAPGFGHGHGPLNHLAAAD